MKASAILSLALFSCVQTLCFAATQPTHQPRKEMKLDLGGNVSLKLVLIPAGKFVMGSPEGEINRKKDELQHEVTISKPFYMSIHLVTVDQFAAFMKDSGYRTDAEKEGSSNGIELKDGKLGNRKMNGASWRDPSFDQKGDHPVVQVSWNDAKAFCEWLSKNRGLTAMLPTEAQWEYACRAGAKTAWPWGENPDDGISWANCADQSLKKVLYNNGDAVKFFNWDDGVVFTSPAGSFRPNAFGLFDMIGNAAHWCLDRYGDYGAGAVVDPTGAPTGMARVVRGGSWNNYNPWNCRSAARYRFAPNFRNERYGFRITVEETANQASQAIGAPAPLPGR